jgi:two-component system response regulator
VIPEARQTVEVARAIRPVILVVDDEPGIRESFRLMLEDDYELLEACDGPEALEIVQSREVNLVLLDILMPGMDGIEVLERIRADRRLETLPVVILTVSAREEDVVRCYHLGANTYIQKPPEFQQFIRLLEVLGEYWFVLAKLPRAA